MKRSHCFSVMLITAGLFACAGRPGSLKTLGPTLADRRENADAFRYRPIEVEPVQSEPEPEPVLAARVLPRLGDDAPRQLDLRGAALSEALHLITQTAGVNVYLDAGLDRRIDASFPSVTLDDALRVLLERNGLEMVEEPAGVFWVANRDGTQLETARFRLASIEASDIAQNLTDLVAEGTKVVVDSTQNFVLVRGPRSEIDAVAEYLEEADRLKAQVLIEVEILEVALDDGFELGVQALLNDPNFLGEANIDAVSDLRTGDLSFTSLISLKDASVDLTINALESYGLVNVISSPRVLAVDNTQSKIDVVREIPYIQTTTSITSQAGQQGTTSQQEVEFKEAGIKLTVTPAVQAEGVVQLALEQEFSEVVDQFLGIPVLDSRKIVSQFLVGESETVVIGGLIQTRTEEKDRGVPVLMHIPLIGRLFRSDEDRLARRELVVMITPRILAPAQAAAYSRKYRANYEERLRSQGVSEEE